MQNLEKQGMGADDAKAEGKWRCLTTFRSNYAVYSLAGSFDKDSGS